MASNFIKVEADTITVELRDCPFCGGKPYVHEVHLGDDGLDDAWEIHCDKCPAMMQEVQTGLQSMKELESIVEAWNRG